MKNKVCQVPDSFIENVSGKLNEPIFPDSSEKDNISDDLILFETVAKRGQPLSISDLFKSRIRYWFSKLKNE